MLSASGNHSIMSVETLLAKLLDGQTDIKVGQELIKSDIGQIRDNLETFKKETNTTLGQHDGRIKQLEEEVADLKQKEADRVEENRKVAIRRDLHDKMNNILMYGVCDTHAWESKDISKKYVKQFLNEALKVDDVDSIEFDDVPRLPQNPSSNFRNDGHRYATRRNTSATLKPRPIIFRVKSRLDFNRIWDNVANLKAYNDAAKEDESMPSIYISRHLPQVLQDERKLLLKDYHIAKNQGKKARIRIDFDNMKMFLDVEEATSNDLCHYCYVYFTYNSLFRNLSIAYCFKLS